MTEIHLISLMIFMPIVAGFTLLTISCFCSKITGFLFGMATSIATFGLAVIAWLFFDKNAIGFQFTESTTRYIVGLDGLSLLFVILTTFLTPLCIISINNSVKSGTSKYIALFLMLEGLIIGSFAAIDLVLFYIFFEAVLIPMFFIVGIWGGEKRVYASFKLFLYTLFGSVFMLIGIIYIQNFFGTGDYRIIKEIASIKISTNIQVMLTILFLASFAIKIPMIPFHTWLPDVHVQAPTAGSMILAAVLLKMGGYGMLRFCLPLFPDGVAFLSPIIILLSLVAIIYASLIALAQSDIKKMIAYSSIAHMGFVTLGIFSGSKLAINGAIMQMISHGIISAALFFSVGVIYDRMHTREIIDFGGVAEKMPRYAVAFMIFMMGSVGLPGTSGFVGEFMIIAGSFILHPIAAIIAGFGLVLGASYMLWLYARTFFGIASGDRLNLSDLNYKEQAVLWLLAIVMLVLGLYPAIVLNLIGS